ncbi:MAG: universal stress protein [Beijerinckiaceae bacterium]|nr:universal stress protein [Beijerinckiaceae bacterium]
MYTSILVPVDLADRALAHKAMQTAVKIAEWTGASVRLVHVQRAIAEVYVDYLPPDVDMSLTRMHEHDLDQLAREIQLPSERVSAGVRSGRVYKEVLAEARDVGADLIVVGSRLPSMSTFIMGSNAKTIVRHAECSVLVVR